VDIARFVTEMYCSTFILLPIFLMAFHWLLISCNGEITKSQN
jgi:hypothetical protein